jgi:anthranilate/para-aminobenzoate synthase component I
VSAFLKLEKGQAVRVSSRERRRRRNGAAIPFWDAIPFLICRYRKGQPSDEFMQNLRSTLRRFKSVTLPNLPPFTGGAVGYFGYDMVRAIENIPDTGAMTLASTTQS